MNDFKREVEVVYKGEVYSVRDNGAIMRHAKNSAKPRPKDNIWTFGVKDEKTGYLLWVSCRVHIIVCLAFNGEMPEPEMVVDHIDTNRCNNRPENLRWLTRLENVIFNPITRAKIIECCGSIEAFIENPSILDKYVNEHSNFKWMRTVTPQEAKNAMAHWSQWCNDPNRSKPTGKGVGDWIYQQPISRNRQQNTQSSVFSHEGRGDDSLDMEYPSLTSNAVQVKWKTPTEFLCCPPNDSLIDYFGNLASNKVFSRNQYGEQLVVDFAKSIDVLHIWVISSQPNGMKPYCLAEISFNGKQFVHKSLGTFFELNGAEKQFTIAQGKEWTGGQVMDDLC